MHIVHHALLLLQNHFDIYHGVHLYGHGAFSAAAAAAAAAAFL